MFGVVSTLGLLAVRPAIKKRLHIAGPIRRSWESRRSKAPAATVIEEVAEGRGMVKIGGELWSARPYDVTRVFEAGTQVKVIEVKGATALVWRD